MGRSLADDLADDVSRTFLATDQFGESVRRYPGGDTDNPDDPVGGLFDEREPDRSVQNGDVVVRKGCLQLATATQAEQEDSWLIRGEEWQVTSIGTALAGLKPVYVERRDVERTTRQERGRII